VLANAGYAALVWLGVRAFGLNGTGIAFFVLYVVHFTVVYFLVRHLTGFRLSAANRQLALLYMPLVAIIFVAGSVLPLAGAVALGVVVTVPTGIYSLKMLCALVPMERLPRAAQKLIRFFRLAPANV